MKQLHRNDLFGWSEFNPERNLDFHSVLWVRPDGNILIDPLPLSAHNEQHLLQLGGAKAIIITNSDHCRAAEPIAKLTGATLYGPRLEQSYFPVTCDRWLGDDEEIVAGLISYEMHGSKTPGELALVLQDNTLITGDLIRSHLGGQLCLLPTTKLANKDLAIQSVRRMANLPSINTVLVGDGWPLFVQGGQALKELAYTLT